MANRKDITDWVMVICIACQFIYNVIDSMSGMNYSERLTKVETEINGYEQQVKIITNRQDIVADKVTNLEGGDAP